jgi:hypothetical protein
MLANLIYASSSQLSGTSPTSTSTVGGTCTGEGEGAARDLGRGVDDDDAGCVVADASAPPMSQAFGLGEGARCADDGRATTDVQPRVPADGCDDGVGVEDSERPNVTAGRGAGARRSASLPSDGVEDAVWATVAERRGVGTRLSTRLKSWTLRCGSWSTI